MKYRVHYTETHTGLSDDNVDYDTIIEARNNKEAMKKARKVVEDHEEASKKAGNIYSDCRLRGVKIIKKEAISIPEETEEVPLN